MSSHDIVESRFRFEFKNGLFIKALGFSGIGFLALIVGFLIDPQKTWGVFLVNSYYFSMLALSALFILALHYLTGSTWFEGLRKIPEAMTSYLPWGFLLFLPVYFGMNSLYHWTDPHAAHDPILSSRALYMNVPGFMLRAILFFIVWYGFSIAFKRLHAVPYTAQEYAKQRKHRVVASALFVIFFAYTFSLAAFEWIMSIEPHWYSTVFAVYVFSGVFVNGLSVVTVSVLLLKKRGYFQSIGDAHLTDLGKYLFAFSCFWAYIWFCQYVLIWYANIPEETVYYKIRTEHDWGWLFYFNLVINFLLPFVTLLSRTAKKNQEHLLRVAGIILVGHWLDLYLLVIPGLHRKDPGIGLVEVISPLGFAGLFIWGVAKALNNKSVYPEESPYLKASFDHHHS